MSALVRGTVSVVPAFSIAVVDETLTGPEGLESGPRLATPAGALVCFPRRRS
jgi:hypothetical protein